MNSDRASDPAEARRVLEAFANAGGDFIDTSSAYQFGRAEEITGAFLADACRDGFVVASKYGRTAQAAPAPASAGSHRKAMLAEVEGSLRRLGTDRIDLYFPHFDDGVTPVEEIMSGLDGLVRAGKVVHIGLSNFPAWRIASAAMLAELRGWASMSVLQLQYGLLAREADREHLPLARARGMGVMGYSPLAGGNLSARTRARAARRSSGAPAEPADAVADTVLDVAGELGCEPASVALAWVETMGVIPIIGPRDEAQLAANLARADIRLDEAQRARLDEASRPNLGQPYELLAQVRAQAGLDDLSAGSVL